MYTILCIYILRLRAPGDSGHRVVVCVSRGASFDAAEFAGADLQPGTCVYIFMHVFMYSCILYIHIYKYTHISIYIYLYICMYVICMICTKIHEYVHVHVCVYAYGYAYVCMYVCIYVMHMSIYEFMNTHTHADTCI
jgi:hypothetical protein